MDLSQLPQPVPDETHGMLLKLSRRAFADLARQEYAYDTVEVAVEVYDADGPRVQHALAFMKPPHRPDGVLAFTDVLPLIGRAEVASS